MKQGLQVAKTYGKDRLVRPETGAPEDLEPGEGRIMEYKGQKAAVCKTVEGHVHVLHPECTHMGCFVTWNNAEQTWDCPCHGSIYKADGEVIHGPALGFLAPIRGES